MAAITRDGTPTPPTAIPPFEISPNNGGGVATMPEAEGMGGEMPMIYVQAEKLGSKCCGCLCDTRRAVIWANSFFIGYATFLLLSREEVVQLTYDNYNDDAFATEVSIIVEDYYRKRSIPLGIALGTAVLSEVGAIAFWTSLVALHIIALTADFIAFCFLALALYHEMQVTLAEVNQVPVAPVMSFVLNGCLTLLFLYPQVGFLLECRMGIMSAETYAREDYSCCCNRRKPAEFLPTSTMTTVVLPEQYAISSGTSTPPAATPVHYNLPSPA